MTPDVKKDLNVIPASEGALSAAYDLGFYAIGYERRSRFVASKLIDNTSSLCGFEYSTGALAIEENRSWASESGVSIHTLKGYEIDNGGDLLHFVQRALTKWATDRREKRLFVDVSSMDRSLIARLLHSIFAIIEPPFNLRLFYAPAAFIEPEYAFIPIRGCAPAIPELSGVLGPHESSLTLILGLGFEYGVSLGLLQQLEPDRAIIFAPIGTDSRYDHAVKEANFDFDFGLENACLVPYEISQPVALFDSIFSLTADATFSHRIVIAPNGPKILAAIATVVALYRHPLITILRASLASSPPAHHVEAAGDVVAIDLVA